MIIIGVILSLLIILLIYFLTLKISGLNQQINLLTQNINERLKETSLSLETTHKIVGERLDSATKVFGDVKLSLGRLEENYRQIYEMTKGISNLENLLRVPKFRGEFGETLLEKLLEDIIPKEFIRFQYRFRNSEKVDAVIMVGKNLIPVDAKFPLDNFKRFSEADSEDEKKTFYRTFVRDIKNRIDEVSSKYILPDEDTFDFAFMYIPVESIYYHISQDEEITSYAKSKRVIFVSPNTFYAYLQAILFGLKGINIQKNIKKIFLSLSQLQQELKKFQEDFELLGSHLVNATKKYNDSRIKLETFSHKLNSTTSNQIEYEQGGLNG
jgi:DNA recombination protein RmuC